jgi:hypothetical protein
MVALVAEQLGLERWSAQEDADGNSFLQYFRAWL